MVIIFNFELLLGIYKENNLIHGTIIIIIILSTTRFKTQLFVMPRHKNNSQNYNYVPRFKIFFLF